MTPIRHTGKNLLIATLIFVDWRSTLWVNSPSQSEKASQEVLFVCSFYENRISTVFLNLSEAGLGQIAKNIGVLPSMLDACSFASFDDRWAVFLRHQKWKKLRAPLVGAFFVFEVKNSLHLTFSIKFRKTKAEMKNAQAANLSILEIQE